MLDQRFILYTRPDRGVSVCAPSLTALRYMTNGGGRWDGFEPGFIDRQVVAQAEYGVGERAAHRFVMAMQFGGCTDAEAYEIMRDRFCAPHGSAFELVDEVPFDRWFRNAWRRSHNGGPIYIDMPIARRIQMTRLIKWAENVNATVQKDKWKMRFRKAKSPEELQHIWPKRLGVNDSS